MIYILTTMVVMCKERQIIKNFNKKLKIYILIKCNVK